MLALALLATLTTNAPCDAEWLSMAANKADQETVEWVKQQLLEDQELVKRRHGEIDVIPSTHKKCLTTVSSQGEEVKETSVYVMISFSVPDQTWVSLSAEMEKIGAVFVLRGLPSNSFKELSKKLQHLSKLGVKSEVRLDPMLYTTYKIEKAPTFLIIDKDKEEYHTLSGNVSLGFAMETMVGKGENQ